MNDEYTLTRYYERIGYKNLDSANLRLDAQEAYQKSKDKQEHKIGRCYYLIACHDLKVFFTVDSGD